MAKQTTRSSKQISQNHRMKQQKKGIPNPLYSYINKVTSHPSSKEALIAILALFLTLLGNDFPSLERGMDVLDFLASTFALGTFPLFEGVLVEESGVFLFVGSRSGTTANSPGLLARVGVRGASARLKLWRWLLGNLLLLDWTTFICSRRSGVVSSFFFEALGTPAALDIFWLAEASCLDVCSFNSKEVFPAVTPPGPIICLKHRRANK